MTAPDFDRLGTPRTDWTLDEVRAIHDAPFSDLLFHAQRVHRANFEPNRVQVSTLISVKTGACPEDCKYCPQSVRYDTGLDREDLLDVGAVVAAAQAAKASGATRFCMGAAYRSPKPRQLEQIKQMVQEVRALGLETCATAGMLTSQQARELKDAGLDYYNHNLDTSPEFYGEIVTTRTYQDRLDTLQAVRDAGISVCCGGILGMGESDTRPRRRCCTRWPTLPQHPESVPINQLVQVPGTPLHGLPELDPLELVRAIATARLLMPRSYVRLSAGTHRHERRRAGAVLPRRRQLDLLRRPPADDAEPGPQPRPAAVRRAWASRPEPAAAVAGCGNARRADAARRRSPRRRAAALAAAGRSRRRRTLTAREPRWRPRHGRRPRLRRLLQQRLPRPGRSPARSSPRSARAAARVGRRQRRVAPRQRPRPASTHALEEELAAVRRPAARAAVLDRLHGEPRASARVLAGRGDRVLEDRLNHASLLDAGLASRRALRALCPRRRRGAARPARSRRARPARRWS